MDKNINQKSKKMLNDMNTQDQTEIFIGGLPNNTDDESLSELLSRYTKINELNVKRRNNKKTKKCLGYAIAKVDQSKAHKLIEVAYLNYKDRRISLTKNLKGKELEDFQKKFAKRRLFIKDLPKDTEPEFLQKTFSRFGPLDSFYIRGQPGTDLKLGVVIFKERKSALSAFHYSTNKMIDELERLGTGVEFDYVKVRHKEVEKESNEAHKKVEKKKIHFHQNQINPNTEQRLLKPKMVMRERIQRHQKRDKNIKHWIKPGMSSFCYEDHVSRHFGKNVSFSDQAYGQRNGSVEDMMIELGGWF